MEILSGVLDVATEVGVAVAVSVRPCQLAGADVERPAAWVRHLATVGRQAVIDVVDDIRHGDLSALSRARVPLVVIDPLTLPRRQVTSVGATNFAGGVAATEHLLTLGHRRIAYMGTGVNFAYNQARMHGYRAALEAGGVEVPDGYVRNGSSRYQAGVAGGGILLDLHQRPTAIVAATDEVAAGVIEAARARVLRVPEDLSIVGFDDTDVARLLSPPLTTIRQPLREMGRVALRTALRLADGEQLDSHHVELATELIVRRSTAPPT
jgi:LacI family transcriptional regulator